MARKLKSVPIGRYAEISISGDSSTFNRGVRSIGNDQWEFQAGQSVIFQITNVNILGTRYQVQTASPLYKKVPKSKIKALKKVTKKSILQAVDEMFSRQKNLFVDSYDDIILPSKTVYWEFSKFGPSPILWSFRTSTKSDACTVAVKVWSTWIPGMLENR